VHDRRCRGRFADRRGKGKGFPGTSIKEDRSCLESRHGN
jgi:hypothetical protein